MMKKKIIKDLPGCKVNSTEMQEKEVRLLQLKTATHQVFSVTEHLFSLMPGQLFESLLEGRNASLKS